MARTANQTKERCRNLQRKWNTRRTKFVDWYNILLLKDELEQEGMESVTSNDPRTGYNLAKHLLTSSIISHKIPIEELTPEQIPATTYLESYITKRWANTEKQYRRMGRQSWLGELVGLLLAGGWYSVFAMVTPDRVWTELWHPAEVFPDFGSEGLVECAHIYVLSASAVNRKIKLMGWKVTQPFRGNTTIYDHWDYDDDGNVANSIIIGNDYVKLPTKELTLEEIPIFTGPVGGLPDRGSIVGGNRWQEHFGESIVATNEELAKNYNKMRSFAQQATREAAQARWLELSSGDTPILTEESLSRWGSIHRGAVGESAGPLQPPALPAELTSIMFTYQNELQRGLFPWAVFGNIQQQISYLAMANIASASLQVLTPYMDAIKGLLTDIDNFWIRMIRKNNYHPHNFVMPENLPDEVEFEADADVEIPGYTIQKATVARMLDPTFRLSTTTVMDKMFPEIKDAIREQANVRKDDAMMHPKAIIVDQIIAYREQARLLRDAGDVDSAALYEKLAKSMEAELEVAPTALPTPRPGATPTVPREVMPGEMVEPTEGMTRIT